MPMNNWSFRRNGKHPTDTFKSPSSLTLDGELLKARCCFKSKKPSNSLDNSRVSPAPPSPILSGLPPAVPPKTLGDPWVFSPAVRENGSQQPVALAREPTESPGLSRVPSGVVMVADIAMNPKTPTPSSTATSIHSASEMQFSVLALTALDDLNRLPPVTACRSEAKPVLSDSVLVPPAVRIPVPSVTPEESIQEEPVVSSTGSLQRSLVMVRAHTVTHSNGVSPELTEAERSNITPPTAPPKPLPQPPSSQQPTPSIAIDSMASPISDSPTSSPTSVMDISDNFFASKEDNFPSPQQQPPPQQCRSQQQQQQVQQRSEELSQTIRHEPPRTYVPPFSPPPPPPQRPEASPPTRVPPKRNVPTPPSSFITDPAFLLRRLFNDPLYSDMDLSVDDVRFHVHRGILAEHCSYFRVFFTDARAQEPTTEIRHLDCSYAPITFECGRPFSIAHVDSGDDSIIHLADKPRARDHARRDRSVQNPKGGRDVLGSEDDEDGLCFADVEESSSTSHYYGPLGLSRVMGQQRHRHPTDTTCSSSGPPPSGPKVDSGATLHPIIPKSASSATPTAPDDEAMTSFSAAFITADQRSVGYTSHHFACFLQILYGLLHPLHLHEDDLLAVFRIAHIYGVPGLVSLLGDRIWDTLELTTETWPCLVRFSERFCLEDIKRRALKHASETREMWMIAVETLGLDDFKVFLRGIDQPERGKAPVGGSQRQGGDLRGLKDELLMMFLLVHYQESSGSKVVDPVLLHDEDGNRHTGASLGQRLSKIQSRDSARVMIRQQVQQRPPTPGLHPLNLPSRINGNSKSNNSGKKTAGANHQPPFTDSLAQDLGSLSSSPPSSLERLPAKAQTTKVDKAKLWMTRFKRDCGWGGQVSLLD
ncbi:hypothetical protein BKA57DRAFT_504069 [Linnemannia elongata]|nr:hypothetical protein BKA57DRAFT_504069 [Linnemannia elongata]